MASPVVSLYEIKNKLKRHLTTEELDFVEKSALIRYRDFPRYIDPEFSHKDADYRFAKAVHNLFALSRHFDLDRFPEMKTRCYELCQEVEEMERNYRTTRDEEKRIWKLRSASARWEQMRSEQASRRGY